MRSMLPTRGWLTRRARRSARWAVFTMLVSQLVVVGAVPAMAKVPELDHFFCYPAKGEPIGVKVVLQDQFDEHPVVTAVGAPTRFCNPVTKVHDNVVTEIRDPDAHLTFYRIRPAVSSPWSVLVYNQFGRQKLRTGAATELAVLMDAQRQLEANANMIRYQDQTLGRLVNDVGKIG